MKLTINLADVNERTTARTIIALFDEFDEAEEIEAPPELVEQEPELVEQEPEPEPEITPEPEPVPEPKPERPKATLPTEQVSLEEVTTAIRQAIIKDKKLTQDDVKEMYKPYGVERVSELSGNRLNQFFKEFQAAVAAAGNEE